MSKNAPRGKSNSNTRGKGKKQPVDPAARRKQIFVGLAMGAVMGLVLGFLTQFWLWLPAGLSMGLATGAIMRPPAE